MLIFEVSKKSDMKYTLMVVVGLLLVSCSVKHKNNSDNKSSDDNKEVTKQVDAVNPNGTSELALLMRQMTDELEGVKDKIGRGEKFILDVNHSNLLVAKPTAAFMKKESYNGFAQTLIHQFNTLQAEPSIKSYNSVVTSCIACHEQSCPGPITRINKLYLYE